VPSHSLNISHQLLGVITGQSSGRQLFRDHAGQEPPLWERLAQVIATALILAGLPIGLRAIWRRYRSSAIALTLAFVLAIAMTRFRPFSTGSRRQVALLATLTSIVFVGEVIVGVGPSWARLPGPYLVSADNRSIDPQSVDVALWMRSYLAPGNRIATDRVNGLLTGSYGEQYPVAHVNAGIDVAPVFFGGGFGPVQQGIIRQGKIRFLVVDRLLSTGLPLEGVYIDDSEPDALRHTRPIAPAALAKFTRLVDVSQIYDGGNILIYKMGASPHEP